MLKSVSSITNAIGALNYKGTWDASANTPTLTSSVGVKGDYYVVSTAGSTSLDGVSNWGIGDWAVFNGATWQRLEGGADGNFVNLSATGTTTSPLLVGGTGTTSTLALRSTSGVGAVGADIVFQVGNNGATEAARVLNSGNVGIGTSSPTYKLQVAPSGATVDQLAVFRDTSTWTANGGVVLSNYYNNTTNIAGIKVSAENVSQGYLTFHTGGTTERVRITTAGNVGIGTSSPSYKLDVNGDINIPTANAYKLGTASIISYSGGAVNITDAGGVLNVKSTGALGLYTAGTVKATIDSSGNVGIGTSSPTNTLSWGYAIDMVGTVGSPGAIIYMRNPSNATAYGYVGFYSSAMRVWNNYPGVITFGTDNTERMRITSAGLVGIGTATPSYDLDVVKAYTSGDVYATLRLSSNAYGYVLNGGIKSGSGGELYFQYYNNGAVAEVMRLTYQGNVLLTGPGGLGYGTGSGGAVTQTTSRTQGVTLDKTNGAITLVSAAGTTTWQTFTVTNNKVAATDTVIVNQKSGTDLYMIHVTNVSAGSFKITFATTGGTTTEQPVFNFAVIKAVTS